MAKSLRKVQWRKVPVGHPAFFEGRIVQKRVYLNAPKGYASVYGYDNLFKQAVIVGNYQWVEVV